jgi:predicted metalloprotease
MALPRRGASLGCGGILVLVVLAYFFGVDPQALLQQVDLAPAPAAGPAPSAGSASPADELGQFAAVVLASTEDVWTQLFADRGHRYELPILVLFEERVDSACGLASAAVGPFYCPLDGKLYLDLGFFRQLDQGLGAPGDFAQAYVIAHEVGHHVQSRLGISDEVRRMQERSAERDANALSVLLELQADCLAGVWGHHANRQRRLLEPGDVEEGLRAAAAIGDDVLQRHAGERVQSESWTHGSAQMRQRWLRQGLESGDPDACDTFSAEAR